MPAYDEAIKDLQASFTKKKEEDGAIKQDTK